MQVVTAREEIHLEMQNGAIEGALLSAAGTQQIKLVAGIRFQRTYTKNLGKSGLATLSQLPQLLNRPQLRRRPRQLRLRLGNLDRPDAVA